MVNCKHCQKEVTQTEGRRKREFCNSSCRSLFWYNLNKKGKPKKEKEPSELARNLSEMSQHALAVVMSRPKSEIPPMPVKRPGEDAFEFAARKNEWKKKYG